VTASIDFEIRRADQALVQTLLNQPGTSEILSRETSRQPDSSATLDSKVRLTIVFNSAASFAPRQDARETVVARDVAESMKSLSDSASANGGRTLDHQLTRDADGRDQAHLIIDVPLSAAPEMQERLAGAGSIRDSQIVRNAGAPQGSLARARFDITLVDERPDSLGARFEQGWHTSLRGLTLSVQYLVVAVLVLGPWLVLAWILMRLFRRRAPRTA
jgi:hypothetical protein